MSGYRERKAALRSFPLLPKPKVKGYLEAFDEGSYAGVEGDADAEGFARVYTGLGPRKRLANTLVDDSHPEREDWEIRRYKALCGLVGEEEEVGAEDLWEGGEGKVPTARHSRFILWGWSPAKKV